MSVNANVAVSIPTYIRMATVFWSGNVPWYIKVNAEILCSVCSSCVVHCQFRLSPGLLLWMYRMPIEKF